MIIFFKHKKMESPRRNKRRRMDGQLPSNIIYFDEVCNLLIITGNVRGKETRVVIGGGDHKRVYTSEYEITVKKIG